MDIFVVVRNVLIACCVLIVVISGGCTSEKLDVSYRKESLGSLAEKAVKGIDIKKIEGLVAKLDTDDRSERLMILKQLKAETGIDHFYTPPIDQNQNNIDSELKKWSKYSQKLEVAIDEKIPEILSADSISGLYDHVIAIEYLGYKSPHKAFLPILKKIATDPQVKRHLRSQTLDTIVCIPHEGMIDFLIELLGDDVLDNAALDNLERVTGLHFEQLLYNEDDVRKANGELDFKALQSVYSRWWVKRKGPYKYRRGRMLWS